MKINYSFVERIRERSLAASRYCIICGELLEMGEYDYCSMCQSRY